MYFICIFLKHGVLNKKDLLIYFVKIQIKHGIMLWFVIIKVVLIELEYKVYNLEYFWLIYG